jgi:hypothetical protein
MSAKRPLKYEAAGGIVGYTFLYIITIFLRSSGRCNMITDFKLN